MDTINYSEVYKFKV